MIVDAAGKPRELGQAHGEQARDAIARGLDRWRDELATHGRDAEALWRALSRESGFRDAAERWTPGLLEEIEGIAEGANADPDAVFATNCLDEAWWWGRASGGCTAVALADLDDATVIGQNMDLDTWMDTTQVALRLQPADGPSQVLLSRAGVLGLCGANSEGVGVVVNAMDQLPVAADGLPVALVLRGLMELGDIRDAEPWLRSIRHASGQAYTLASRDGVVGFECGGDYTASYNNDAERPGALWHSNHPLTGDFDVGGTGADWASGSSVPRLEAVDRTVGGITSADDVKALLSDADSGICMFPGRWREDGFTFGSIVAELNGGVGVQMTAGPPDRNEWVSVDLP
jgi:isopenicillin-N N-acyltransferase-like protein